MADLLTHYVSARVCGYPIGNRAMAATFVLGVFLPDLISKPLSFPDFMPDFVTAPSHSVTGLALASWAMSLLFAPSFRGRAFLSTYAGSLLHVATDLLKDYLGRGAQTPFHPWTLESFEMGLYQSEDALILLPVNLAVLTILWAVERRSARHRP